MILRTLDEAEEWVENNARAYWDGWDIVIVDPDPAAIYSTSGIWRGGQWAFKQVAERTDDGWVV